MTKIASESVQCVVTSPPYFGLRDYGIAGQIGLEGTPQEYVAKLLTVFMEVRRILKPDGVLWLNLGDSYAGSGCGGNPSDSEHQKQRSNRGLEVFVKSKRNAKRWGGGNVAPTGSLKPKDLIGIPWMIAFALREAGWWLRSDIIWAKRNAMPESVTDRPTRSHEYIFLLTKSAHYFYDNEAIKEPCIYDIDGTGTAARKARASEGLKSHPNGERAGILPGGLKDAKAFNGKNSDKQRGHSRRHDGFNDRWDQMSHGEQRVGMRNKRDVWTVSPAQFREAHFATFPPDLIKPCILAGSRPGDTVLDPFAGSFTTCMVAMEYGRNSIGIELNPEYCEIGRKRCAITPGLQLL